jgi:quercetin dioxygenase-like cupin family protein
MADLEHEPRTGREQERMSMKRVTVATAIAVLLVIALPTGAAFGQQLPPGPTGVYQTTIEVAGLPGPLDVLQAVLDFAPGAWTPPHTHGAHTLNTILDGEVTLRQDGAERTFKPGEMWSDHPGVVHAAGNAGPAPARLLVVFVLPNGAPLTTVQPAGGTQQLPPGPTAVYQTTIELASLPAPFEVIQAVLDFAPGGVDAAPHPRRSDAQHGPRRRDRAAPPGPRAAFPAR